MGWSKITFIYRQDESFGSISALELHYSVRLLHALSEVIIYDTMSTKYLQPSTCSTNFRHILMAKIFLLVMSHMMFSRGFVAVRAQKTLVGFHVAICFVNSSESNAEVLIV